MNGLLSVHQTARYLMVDPDIVQTLIRQGYLTWIAIGREMYIPNRSATQLLIYLLSLALLRHPQLNQ